MPKGSPERTAARKEEIISACEKLYQTMSFKDITLKEIGNETSFSRPTIYNYYQTKEEIFLALFEREYIRWNEELQSILQENEKLSKEQLANKLASSIANRQQLLKLLSMNNYDMEENSRPELLTSFKVAYGESMKNVCRIITKFCPEKSVQEIQDFIYVFFPFMFGIYPYTAVTDKQREAMKQTYCMKCMRPNGGTEVCPHCGYVSGENEIPPHVLRPGTLLMGQYLLGEPLGQGGFGITYIARDLKLNMRVAIKEYFPCGYAIRNVETSERITVTDERLRLDLRQGKDSFLKEAQTLARFKGVIGIVDVLNFFEANDTAYIVMEFLEGETLSSRLKRQLFTADQIFRLMEPVFDALEQIHREDVVHRDVSPDNIMMLPDGRLKLMDFGAARLMNHTDQRSVSVVLKAGYAPKEQYTSRGKQGPWTDIYALAATIYFSITGTVPPESIGFPRMISPSSVACAKPPSVLINAQVLSMRSLSFSRSRIAPVMRVVPSAVAATAASTGTRSGISAALRSIPCKAESFACMLLPSLRIFAPNDCSTSSTLRSPCELFLSSPRTAAPRQSRAAAFDQSPSTA